MNFEILDTMSQEASIKVIGVGGAGGNAVEHMLNSGIEGVDFISINTDAQVLEKSKAPTRMQIGTELTRGLGAGANPDVGREAALEDKARIQEILENTDMLFIAAGMGGGTGTGAAPIIAEIAKSMGILTVAVVTRPFSFEGKRVGVAKAGIDQLGQHCDSLITIPNDKVLELLGHNAPFVEALARADDVLSNAVNGISDLVIKPGMINVDFADVRTVMSINGIAMMGTGRASGEHRAVEATNKAISSPLLDDIDINGAQGILVNITGGYDMSVGEFEAVGKTIQGLVGDDATVVIGTVIDADLSDELRVTVVATGLESSGIITPKPNKEVALEKPVAQMPKERELVRPPVAIEVVSRGGGRRFGTDGSMIDPTSEEFDVPAYLRNRQAD